MAEWQHGLFGCFDNCGLCIITYFVPCYTFGKNAEKMGDSCILCALGFVCVGPILGCLMRSKIRESKGIAGSLVSDILMWWCCPLCALVQEAQELDTGVQGQAIERQ